MKLTPSLLTVVGLACAVMAMPAKSFADEVVTLYDSTQAAAKLHPGLPAQSSDTTHEDVVTLYEAKDVPVRGAARVSNDLYDRLQPAPPSKAADEDGTVVTLYEAGKLYAEVYRPSQSEALSAQYKPAHTASGQAAMYAQAGPAETNPEKDWKYMPVVAESRTKSSEEVMTTSSYSLGMLSGYGFKLGDPPRLDVTEVLPFIAFPISGVLGRSFYRGVLEYKIEPELGLLTSFDNRGEAGLSPVGVRYNFTGMGGRTVPYVEGQLGAVYLDVPNSVQGSTFNFISGASAGVKYFITPKTALNFQCRYRHLSNAGIRQPNPGENMVQLLVGISHY